jgi:hypothetical protein
MSTTRYVTGDSEGVITLTARAFDPDGSPIIQQFSVKVNPQPLVPKCYTSVQALSPVQQDIGSACAQFGIANTYYLGAPRNTFYLDDSCSTIAPDGFYKTENDNWISINGGVIRQQGSCSSIATRTGNARVATPPGSGPQRFETGGVTNLGPISSTRIEGLRQQVFIPEPTFTPPSPTLVKPDPAFIAERAAAKAAQQLTQVPEQVILSTTVSQMVGSQRTARQNVAATPIAIPSIFTPAVAPAPAPVFGCVDPTAVNYNPNATVDDGSCQYQQRGFTIDNAEQL